MSSRQRDLDAETRGAPARDPEHVQYYDWAAADDISTTVVRALATATDTPFTELPPLAAAVDPEALNDLFRSPSGPGTPESLRVSFAYAGRYVVITRDGVVRIYLSEDEAGDA